MGQEIACRIRVQGHLGPEWSSWFAGLAVVPEPDESTLLAGSLADQSALHGLLGVIRDLGLTLVSVEVTTTEPVATVAPPEQRARGGGTQ